MPITFIPFSSIDPNEHSLTTQAMRRIENVVPALGGLRSLPKPTNDGALTSAPSFPYLTSCFVHYWPFVAAGFYTGDSPTEFHGGYTDLLGVKTPRIYTFAAGAFAEVSRVAPYTSGSLPAWRFASFGNDVWAVDWTNHPQRRIANAGLFVDGVSSTFVPIPRFISPVRDFMVAVSLSNGELDQFTWSDKNDATWYDDRTGARPASLAGGSIGQRVLSRPGQITGFAGGEYGVFWKRNSMHVLNFTGGNDVWRLDTISSSVGTPCPSSIVECRDGARRFWGGDRFYEQRGQGEPVGIGGEALSAILLDANAYLGNLALNLDASFNYGHHEDGLMFGAEDPELGVVFWLYRGTDNGVSGGVAVPAAHGIAYNYATGEWSTLALAAGVYSLGSNRSFMTADTELPRFIFGAYAPGGLAANGGAVQRFRFQSSTFHAITVASQRFTIEQQGAPEQAQYVRVRGVMPVVTTRQATLGTDYRLAALPAELTIRLIASNDQHFQQQVDEIGQVSPRSVAMTIADANNDFGWLSPALEGRCFLAELSAPEGVVPFRGLRGFWIDYEVAG